MTSHELAVERAEKKYRNRGSFLRWFNRRGHTRMKDNRTAVRPRKRLQRGFAFQAWDGSGLVVLPDTMVDN